MSDKVILNLSTVLSGGAGNYALQNHRLLQKFGYDSYLIVKDKIQKNDDKIIQYPNSKLENIIPKTKRKIWRIVLNKFQYAEKYYFYNKYEQINCYSAKTILNQLPRYPNAIFIYWASGFINAKLIHDLATKTKARIYILMIDNAPITGGCHYPWECKGYENDCSNCPAIQSKLIKKLAKENLAYKKRYKLDNVSLIVPTQTDYQRVKNSSLFNSSSCFKLFEIIDEERFKPPLSKNDMKTYFNIEENKKVVFFGATFLNEERKGMKQMMQVINLIKSEGVVLLIAGTADIGDISLENKRVGYLTETELINAYQAADLFVCPSLEDSGPLMINQSIMCGTPVVAFNMGSAIDLVITGKTGYKAKFADIDDLARGIDYVLSLNRTDSETMAKECRNLAMSLYSTSVFEKKINEMLIDDED